jgi:hypothetical protein
VNKLALTLLVTSFTLSSCSSLKRTLVYSAASGAVAGASSGVLLSPNKESRGANGVVFGLVGAALTGLVGYALYEDDPRNYKLKHMLTPKKEVEEDDLAIDLGKIKINADLTKKESHSVPVTNLPKELEGKVSKQFLIKYQSKERYVKKGNKTFYIPSFSVFEHAYEDKGALKDE